MNEHLETESDKLGQTMDNTEEKTEPTLSPEQLKISALEAEIAEEKKKYLYLYAEFDNFKKRTVKERSDLLKFGWEKVARDLLDVVDNLDRAVEHMPETTDKNLKTGIEMILSQFKGTLEKQGVSSIKTEGEDFNPDHHEAMTQEPSELPAGKITKALTKGYLLHGRLLRAAKVVVSKGNS